MWVEACSLIVVFVSSNYIPDYVSKKICAYFFSGGLMAQEWRKPGVFWDPIKLQQQQSKAKITLSNKIRILYGIKWYIGSKIWTLHNNWQQHIICTFTSILKHKIFENIWVDKECETMMSLTFQTGWLLHILKTRTWSLFPATMQ